MHESAQLDVALVYQSSPFPAAMRAALDVLGVRISYESSVATFNLAALKDAGARAILINLDSSHDETLDVVDALLEDNVYPLIFNDAEVSGGLSGSDQARWARHLAAKLHGDVNVLLPLRPAGAEFVGNPTVPAVDVVHHRVAETAAVSEENIAPLDDDVTQDPGTAAHVTDAQPSYEFAHEPVNDSRIDASDDPVAAASLPLHDNLQQDTIVAAHATEQNPAFEIADEFIGARSRVVGDSDTHSPDATPLQTPDEDFVPETVVSQVSSSYDELSETEIAPMHSSDYPDEPVSAIEHHADASHAAIEWQLQDTAEALAFAGGHGVDDIASGGSAKDFPARTDVTETAQIESSSDWFQRKNEDILRTDVTSSDHDWALFDPDIAAKAPITPVTIVADTPAQHFESEWSLAPLHDDSASAAHIADAKQVIPRVWLLLGSIGAPEALREFLGALPEKLAALLIVLQHIGTDFQATLTAKLVEASPLPVRMIEGDMTTAASEVLLLAPQSRVHLNQDGRVSLRADADEGISAAEWNMHDLAENFGTRAGVILLSGTVPGALQGCQHIAHAGGPIWAQHSDSCVISSMIDSASDAGLIQYSAPPRQLAIRLAAICANLAE